jgi:pimeloyl-ACP methyl ester carboxylesterase
VWPKIQAVLKAATPTKIFVTGHSLGGALAVLTAEKINTVLPGRVRAVYTFGMPRTGDRNFATGYNQSLGARTYRLAHGNDVVPTVAPSSLGFRHVGRYLHCARQGKFDPQALDPTPGSDLPPFLNGLAANLKDLLHGPLTNVVSDSVRINLAAAFQLGAVPAGMRTDPGGLVIELLPPPLRDHMPDRYIEAT